MPYPFFQNRANFVLYYVFLTEARILCRPVQIPIMPSDYKTSYMSKSWYGLHLALRVKQIAINRNLLQNGPSYANAQRAVIQNTERTTSVDHSIMLLP